MNRKKIVFLLVLAFFVSLDNPASSLLTQELLDWHPTHPGLIDDLNEGHYFQV